MSEEADVGVDDDGVAVNPYGRSTSIYVAFTGPGISGLDLTPPRDMEESDGTTGASSGSTQQQRDLRELGDDAVWLLSSAKVGNGVEQLRDNDSLTFWQSDGVLPHALTIQFHKMTRVSCVCLYLDQKLDESYSPSRLSIRVGNGAASADVTPDGQPLQQGIREMDKFEIEEPQGWLVCHLIRPTEDSTGEGKSSAPTRCHFVQVVILNSFQNGRDTHIRQVKIFGPRQSTASKGILAELENFTSLEFKQFASIR